MSLAAFEVPGIVDNADGWGPTTIPEHLEGLPYAPFGKGDKVGRISDFTQTGFNKYGGRYGQNQPTVAVFNFFHNEDEDSFHLVDNKPAQRKQGMRRFQPNRFQQRRDQQNQRGDMQVHQDRQPRKQQNKRPQFFHRNEQRQVVHSSSVDIRPEWVVVEQIPFTSLSKLNYQAPAPEDLAFYGQLEYYDKSYDRITPKTDKALKKTSRAFRSVTTSDDPVIRQYAKEDAAQVFITDSLLTTLMCTPRSVYSWDILVTRAAGKLFFDKRDGSALDLLTVAETSPEAIPEDKDNINGMQQLSLEATAINQNFSQQVLLQGGKTLKYDQPNPFMGEGSEELAAVAYRYRKVRMNEEVDLVVRCELDGVMNYKGQDQLLSIKALNEFDPKLTGVDWRQKLENQRGAVLATELKNNANKLAKWTAAALISGTDMIKLGYVSRSNLRDNHNHTVLGTQVCKPKDFAQQINLNMDNCWGIVRALVDLCMKMEDGKYLIVKDPNKQLLRLYSVPEDAFQENYSEEPIPEVEDVPVAEEPPKADAGDED
ncbi:Eukaryotic translation initiation factor 3 subunit D [Coccomyxa sp. Obi]|nr:Eukaryotic translation initiation factor 3 subunit D [Coccomyxa sp. Obi]